MRLRISLRRFRVSAQDVDAYVDGALPARQREALEARLGVDGALRAAAQRAVRVKALLANLPEDIQPARSFRLTPGMVAVAPAPIARAAPRQPLRWGANALAGVSACVLAVAVVAEIGGGSSGRDEGQVAATAAESPNRESAPADAQAAGAADLSSAAATSAAQASPPAATVPPPATGGVSGQTVNDQTPAIATKAAAGAIAPEATAAADDASVESGATTTQSELASEYAFRGSEGSNGGAGWRRVALIAGVAGSIIGVFGSFAFRRKGIPA